MCRLGIHGPRWLGIGANANGPRNRRLGYLHRGCPCCGAEWAAEMIDLGDSWGLHWTRIA